MACTVEVAATSSATQQMVQRTVFRSRPVSTSTCGWSWSAVNPAKIAFTREWMRLKSSRSCACQRGIG